MSLVTWFCLEIVLKKEVLNILAKHCKIGTSFQQIFSLKVEQFIIVHKTEILLLNIMNEKHNSKLVYLLEEDTI